MILDCEAVAWDKENQKILPFRFSTRKRKDVDIKDVKSCCLFAFDILCYNDEKLIGKSLRERRVYLKRVTREVPGEFQYATQLTTDDLDELRQFLDQSIKHSCEGLMVKMLEGEESHYEPSKRSRNWLKLKKDYLEGVGDSFDLCVLGAYWTGKGKRTGTYGGFLLGCYNQDTGEFETACKIGTGFSEGCFSNYTKDCNRQQSTDQRHFTSTTQALNRTFGLNRLYCLKYWQLTCPFPLYIRQEARAITRVFL